MKKITTILVFSLSLVFFLSLANPMPPLWAACPAGYAETTNDADPVIKVVKNDAACPNGYQEVTDKTVLPSGGICDTIKGACDNTGVCQVP